MLCIIRKKDLNYLKNINKEHKNLCIENNNLRKNLKIQEELISNLKKKLNSTKANVYSVEIDRLGNNTFVCVQDNRRFNKCSLRLEGTLNIFVLSSMITPQHCLNKYNDMPYLESEFLGEGIKLYELHSDIVEEYENLGYATMLLDTLVEIAIKCECKIITGFLSSRDAENEKLKNKRNNFYRKYKSAKVELIFKDVEEKEGTVKIYL